MIDKKVVQLKERDYHITSSKTMKRARLINSLVSRWQLFAIDPLGRPVAYRGGIAVSGEPSRVNQVFPAFMLTHFIYSGGVK